VLFRFFQNELALLETMAVAGEISLWFGDESGFNLNPHAMYAWQAPKAGFFVPAERTPILNILGFVNAQQGREFYEFEGSMNSEMFIALVEDFIAKQVQQKTILVLDKASVHTSQVVKEKIGEWKKQNLWIQFLPSYSPELNRIELVWKHIKHHWIAVADWLSLPKVREKIRYILQNFGTEYKIQFKT
jgi:transposase